MAIETRTRTYKDLGPLGELLVRACPADERGIKSIPVLARRLGLANWSVYKWIKDLKIPPDRAVQVVAVAEGRVTLEDLVPYVFR